MHLVGFITEIHMKVGRNGFCWSQALWTGCHRRKGGRLKWTRIFFPRRSDCSSQSAPLGFSATFASS